MGVTGLWRLIEPAGKPVAVETLENKVLAVDISIWLHQMVKGYQDAKGAPLANAHLMGLFQRLCKLLYFRVKPVFVFDGAFPALKRETISKRQDAKQKYNSESERIKRELAILLTKKTAISSLLGKQISTKQSNKGSVQNDDDLFKLPAIPAIPQKDDEISESDDEESSTSSSSVDLHTVDLESQNFKTLPTKEKYDLLLELKETRKMNSWGKLHTLPKKSDNFSDFQLQRLLKRRKVQECLEETEKEMGDSGMSLIELESLLNEEGIDTKIENIPTKRIASNNSTRYLLINDVRQALEDAKKKKLAENQASTSKDEDKASIEDNKSNIEGNKKDELEEDLEKAIKMSLEYSNENDVAGTSKTDDSWTSYKSDESEYFESDSEEEEGCDAPDMTSAKAYIMQYSDFTKKAIDNLTRKSTRAKVKDKKTTNVDDVLKELNFSKSQLVGAGIILSCSDDEADSDVVEVDTIESDSESVNETQASVIVLENPTQEIINLDCSLGIEQTPENSNAKKGILENNVEKELSSDDDIVEVAEIEQMIENKESSNDIQKTVEFATKSNNEYGVESDSTDNDFEEVPDEDNKAVIELNFNVAENLEDDIFADVFSPTKKDKSEITASPSLEVKVDQINQDINEDDELQKAIMMSLECIDEAVPEKANTKITAKEVTLTAATQKTNEEITAKELENPATTVKILESNEKPRVSKTAESLNELLRTETLASDTSKKQAPNKNVVPISEEQLNNMVEEIQNKEQGLEHEKGRLDRIGRNITEQMTKEAQELLQIFGIPYIVAPMEAEAQCAFLESVNLTDGTITDDSDIWLFGGRTVYKNFFNQKKHVLQFLADRIEKSFNLSREQLILLALLVGSDYTTGIDGVGPVTAMEILASFPYRRKLSDDNQTRYSQIITGLQEFKQWVRAGKRTDNVTLKKKLKNITLNDDFPSVRVVQAYLDPNVEKNEDKFSWGEIDITVVRDYAKAKFGWSQHKLDEIIKPVLKRIVERKSQKSMQDYFKRKTDFQSLEDQMSKRVKAAVQKIGDPNPETGEENIIGEVDKEKKGKRKGKKVKESVAGPSKAKKKKTDDAVLNSLNVKVVSEDQDGKSDIIIKINKTDRYQEIIPQREKDKQSLLQNKMKAIELFRKTNIDKRKKLTKRKPLVPKDKAELSESSDSN